MCQMAAMTNGRMSLAVSDKDVKLIWVNTTNQCKKEGKDQESIQTSTTSDPGYQWESDNGTIRHHKREPRGQQFPSS